MQFDCEVKISRHLFELDEVVAVNYKEQKSGEKGDVLIELSFSQFYLEDGGLKFNNPLIDDSDYDQNNITLSLPFEDVADFYRELKMQFDLAHIQHT